MISQRIPGKAAGAHTRTPASPGRAPGTMCRRLRGLSNRNVFSLSVGCWIKVLASSVPGERCLPGLGTAVSSQGPCSGPTGSQGVCVISPSSQEGTSAVGSGPHSPSSPLSAFITSQRLHLQVPLGLGSQHMDGSGGYGLVWNMIQRLKLCDTVVIQPSNCVILSISPFCTVC